MKLKIFKISIPITNYYGDGVFFMEYLVNSNFRPSEDQVVELIKGLHQEESAVIGYCGEHESALESIKRLEHWPNGNSSTVRSNSFVSDFGFGKQPLTITKVEVHDFTKFIIKGEG